MNKLVCSVVLLALLGLGTMTPAAYAETCPPGGPQFAVYFDEGGKHRSMDSPGVGLISTVCIVGEGFPAAFVTGAQFKVDYGPCLLWLGDVGCGFPAKLGDTNSGLAAAGRIPLPGTKFIVCRALVAWQCDCSSHENSDYPRVVDHPFLGAPAATRFPDFALLEADGVRSQTCQRVNLDIKPGNCKNGVNVKLWDAEKLGKGRGGTMWVTILGSSTVDPFFIDPKSIKLAGVSAIPERHVLSDLAGPDCDSNADGFLDLTMKFRKADLAAGLPRPSVGQMITLTLTGCYIDGMPFSCSDVINILGNAQAEPVIAGAGGGLGEPVPNPFNPVTRISYQLDKTQHVRLSIYDVAGRLVDELVNGVKSAGEYVVEWNAGTLPSGVYFYRLETGGKTLVKRATLLK